MAIVDNKTNPYKALRDKVMAADVTPQPGAKKPTEPRKATEPGVPDIQEAPTQPSPDAGIRPTPLSEIGDVARQVEAGATLDEPLQFTNRPELLEQGGWILPEGFRMAEPGEEPQGERVDLGDKGFMYYQDPRRGAMPEGTYNYAVMSHLYPEMFEDPRLAPMREELEASRERLAELGATTEEPQITQKDVNTVKAMYDEEIFEQHLIKQMGVNPYTMDPMGEMNYRWKQMERSSFEKAFGGQVAWSDRGNLNKKQLDYWNQVMRRDRAELYNMLNNERTARIQEYDNAMSNFRARKKTHEAAIERRRKEQQEASKAPQYFKIPNKDGVVTHQWWDKNKRQMVDTGVPAKLDDGDLPPDLRRRLKIMNEVEGNQQTKSIAGAIIAANPEMAENPVIKAMSGEADVTPEMKAFIKETKEDAIKYAQSLMKGVEQKTTKKPAPEAEPKEEGEGELKPKSQSGFIKLKSGETAPVFELTDSLFEPGDIVKSEGTFYVITDSDQNFEAYQTEEDAMKKRSEVTTKKAK